MKRKGNAVAETLWVPQTYDRGRIVYRLLFSYIDIIRFTGLQAMITDC